ncbi:MAG: DEAD/DEAH box helicase [Chitinophagales bacterium]
MTPEAVDSIIDFISYADSGVRQRGKQLYNKIKGNNFRLNGKENDFLMEIESSDELHFYDVNLRLLKESGTVLAECNCPFAVKYESTCKHQVAAALCWIDYLRPLQEKSKVKLKEQEYELPSKSSAQKVIPQEKNITGSFIFNIRSMEYWHISSYLNIRIPSWKIKTKCTPIENSIEKKVEAFDDLSHTEARYAGRDKLRITCNCGALTQYWLCDHASDLLLAAGAKFGAYYFRIFDDYSKEIKAVFDSYHLSQNDPVTSHFKFGFDAHGNFIVTEKPAGLIKPGDEQVWNQISRILMADKQQEVVPQKILNIPEGFKHAGLLIMVDGKYASRIWIEALVFYEKKGKEMVTRHELRQPEDLFLFHDFPESVLKKFESLTETAFRKLFAHSGYGYISNFINPFSQLSGDAAKVVEDKFLEVLDSSREFLSSYPHLYILKANQKFNRNNLIQVSFSSFIPRLNFSVTRENPFLCLNAFISIAEQQFQLTDFVNHNNLLLQKDKTLYRIPDNDIKVYGLFQKGRIMIHQNESTAFVKQIILPLVKNYQVELNGVIKFQIVNADPLPAIYLSELNDLYLLLKPKWKYDHVEVSPDDLVGQMVLIEETFYKVSRKVDKEEELMQLIRAQHPMFSRQPNGFFYLPLGEAIRKNWFLDFYHHMQENQVVVYGIKDLKKFRYNTSKADFSVSASSGIDWFDVKIRISFGETIVPLNDLKKAAIAGQNYVLLSDGTIGMLPEEWVHRFSMILKIGELRDDHLQVSKFHWTLIDELHMQLNNEALMLELNEKRKRLSNIGRHGEVSVPEAVKASLRDYQHAGFQWLCLLDHLGWGGCLADDMGLGKTLQTLTFLQHLKEKDKGVTHLIVCPTSLIFNWETEIKKFTPTLNYHLHYGNDRVFNEEEFNAHDIIITSYGMIRSDIEHFSKFKFGYVVLDESQSIKNPSSQISKAVTLLQARNKIILSGTPVQNNTIDLFSQMHFLNHGMLGSMNFFKTEFATPIDKYGDKEKTDQLRRLIYPFLLRRTKEQVAKDLPDKTETILWCEMEKEQRKIYDRFKDHYRESIMKRIEKEGMNKSSIYVLQGLLKLRQICDSPSLLNEEEKFPNVSVKLTELMREVEENTGNHKALIFSQFVTMLSLVEEQLKLRNMKYAYLDGKTKAEKRIEAVKEFQRNDDLKLFLISLKAGGLGLNLTAADYVYLVDPWWNPAVEQQAIDRTHRIGQAKNIFAYKMICKNTVEEKILTLQQKKKALSSELIADETGFVKKLTIDDVRFLFS